MNRSFIRVPNLVLSFVGAACFACGGAPAEDPSGEGASSGESELGKLPGSVFQLMPLNIDHLEPEVPVENRPMHVYFTLRNSTSAPLSGWVGFGAQGSAVTGFFSNGTRLEDDWRVQDLQPGQTLAGVVTLDAPPAGTGRLGTLYFYKERVVAAEFPAAGPHVWERQTPFDTAARFRFSLERLTARSTRDNTYNGDDVAVSTSLLLGGATVYEDAFMAGHVNDKGGVLDLHHRTTPIDVVPPVSPEARFGFAAAHVGNPSHDRLRQALDILSTAGKAAASAATPQYGALYEAGDMLHHFLHSFIQNCDGPVAAGAYAWTSADLDSVTANADSFVRLAGHPGQPSPPNCGGTSLYASEVSGERLRASADTGRIQPQHAEVAPGRTVQFTSNIPSTSVYYTVEGGAANGFIDPKTGLYIAPATLPANGYVIVDAIDTRNSDDPARMAPGKAFVSLAPPRALIARRIYVR